MMKRFILLLSLLALLLPAVARATALDDCSNQIKYGAPSNSGILLCRLAYAVSYNAAHKTPDWVAYRLTEPEIHGNFLRTNNYRADPELDANDSAHIADFRHSGYVPGQMVPSKDMIWSARAMDESYLLSSVVPLNRGMATGIWTALQQKVRDLVQARGELYIVTGPIYDHKTPRTIGPDHVAVPDACFEVIFDPVRVDAIAFVIPNRPAPSQALPNFITSVRDVEQRTGLDFMSKLDDPVQSLVEAKVSPFWLH
jgi:endonuclease G